MKYFLFPIKGHSDMSKGRSKEFHKVHYYLKYTYFR